MIEFCQVQIWLNKTLLEKFGEIMSADVLCVADFSSGTFLKGCDEILKGEIDGFCDFGDG